MGSWKQHDQENTVWGLKDFSIFDNRWQSPAQMNQMSLSQIAITNFLIFNILKNNTKKGFSLSELLIVLAIIGLIAMFGTKIAQKGVENSYKLFFYTGYYGIQAAMSEANLDYPLTNNVISKKFADDVTSILKPKNLLVRKLF